MALRIDVGTLKPARRLADGRLRADAFITRSGVFEYTNPDGSVRREYRPESEVFRADALETFEMVPVTNDHPPMLLTAENAKQYAVGTIGEAVRRDGDHVAASLTVFDAATIEAMNAGKAEVSCGYEVDVENTPGVTPEGVKYDAIQRNIRGNHVAIVSAGRAGKTVRVRMDAPTMSGEVRFDAGASMTLEEKLAAAIQEAETAKVEAKSAKADALAEKQRADGLEKELAEAKGEIATEKERADKAEKARTDAEEGFTSRVRARVELEAAAAPVLGETKFDDKSDREIKMAVVEKIDGEQKFDGKSDDYVQALYDSAIQRVGRTDRALDDIRRTDGVERPPANPDEAERIAAQKMIERNRANYDAARKGANQ